MTTTKHGYLRFVIYEDSLPQCGSLPSQDKQLPQELSAFSAVASELTLYSKSVSYLCIGHPEIFWMTRRSRKENGVELNWLFDVRSLGSLQSVRSSTTWEGSRSEKSAQRD